MSVKLIAIVQIAAVSYIGLTQIGFDSMSDPFSGELYSHLKLQDIQALEDLLDDEQIFAQQANSNNASADSLAIVYVLPEDIGFIKKEQKAIISVESSPSNSAVHTGKIIAIRNSALEPSKEYDYFRYPVLLEIDRQGSKKDLKASLYPITARVQIEEDFTALDWLNRQFMFRGSHSIYLKGDRF